MRRAPMPFEPVTVSLGHKPICYSPRNADWQQENSNERTEQAREDR
jgi:hypothetical protein